MLPNSDLLHLECVRLATFTRFPKGYHTPADLAKLGFYYLGERDCVRCFACGTTIGNWKKYDDIDMRHLGNNPHCPIACSDYTDNISIEEIHSMRPMHPDFATLESRLKSFKLCRYYKNGESLSLAGFFYDAIEQELICYYCNTSLDNVKPGDDILERHGELNQNCNFYKAMTPRTNGNTLSAEEKASLAIARTDDKCFLCEKPAETLHSCGHMRNCCSIEYSLCPVCGYLENDE